MKNKRELTKKVFRFQALMHRYMSQNFRKHGTLRTPHRGQGRVLSILKLKSEISQKELAYLLDIRNQSLGELLKKLEEKGLVERTPSEEDRRIMTVKLTEAGKLAAEETGSEQSDKDGIFACLSEEENAQLSAILDKLIDALKEQVDDKDDRKHMRDMRRHMLAHRDAIVRGGRMARKASNAKDNSDTTEDTTEDV